jgi:hypothetical protein
MGLVRSLSGPPPRASLIIRDGSDALSLESAVLKKDT